MKTVILFSVTITSPHSHLEFFHFLFYNKMDLKHAMILILVLISGKQPKVRVFVK